MSLIYVDDKPQLDKETEDKLIEMAVGQLIESHKDEFQSIVCGFYQAALQYEMAQAAMEVKSRIVKP